MKMKMLVFLLLGSLSIVGIALAESNTNTLIASVAPEKQEVASRSLVSKLGSQFADKPGVINGAENPDLVPDTVAYSLMFRFISGNQSVPAKQRVRSYVMSFGAGDQQCSSCRGKMPDSDIDAIIAAADEYQRRVSVLDVQAEQIKRNNPQGIGLEAMAQLTRLQQQKDAMVTEIIASLPKRLSSNALSKLQSHVNLRVKPKTKYKPNISQESVGMVQGF